MTRSALPAETCNWDPGCSLDTCGCGAVCASHPELRSVVERDGLLVSDGLHERSIERIFRAELDGKSPEEFVVSIFQPGGEGTWTRLYYPYSSDLSRLGGEISLGDYIGGDHLRIVDLDADGRDELVLVGGTDGTNATNLFIYSWDDGEFTDLMWGESPGTGYVHLDLECDGRGEIVALGIDSATRELSVRVLEPGADGTYRTRTDGRDATLRRAFDRIARGRSWGPREVLLSLVVTAMRQRDVVPADLATTQRRLEELHAQMEVDWERAAVIDAMVWPGNDHATPFLRSLIERMSEDRPARGAVYALSKVGDADDRDFLLSQLEKMVGVDDALREAVRGFRERGDDAVVDRLSEWIDRPDSPFGEKPSLFARIAPSDERFVPVLMTIVDDHPDPEMRRLAAGVIADGGRVWQPRHEQWRRAFPDEWLSDLLTDRDPTVRASAASAIAVAAHANAAAPLLEAARVEADPRVLREFLHALSELDGHNGHREFLGRLHSEDDADTRLALHRLVAASDDPQVGAKGLTEVATSRELAQYRHLPKRVASSGGSPELRRVCLGLASHREPRVRQGAARLLAASTMTSRATRSRSSWSRARRGGCSLRRPSHWEPSATRRA